MWAQVQLVLEYSTSTVGNQLINPSNALSEHYHFFDDPTTLRLQASKGTHSRPILSQLILIAPQAAQLCHRRHFSSSEYAGRPAALQLTVLYCTLLDTFDRGQTYSIPNTMARLDGF